MITYRSRAPDTYSRGRSPYVQMLNPHRVARLAVLICERLNFGTYDAALIQSRMRKRLPTILEHGGRRLWIDRYYIAVENDSPAAFQYLYLTRRHVEEALRDHHRLMRLRRPPVLDSETLALYGVALNSMRADRRGYITYPLPT